MLSVVLAVTLESERSISAEIALIWPAASAEVEVSEPTGAETLLLLRVGGERLRARVAPDARLALGQPATFSVDTRTACLFDPQTERLIA